MFLKYLIVADSLTVGLRYCVITGRIELGGNKRALLLIRGILRDYFGVARAEAHATARNKILVAPVRRFELGELDESIEQLRRDGVECTVVRALGRLMR